MTRSIVRPTIAAIVSLLASTVLLACSSAGPTLDGASRNGTTPAFIVGVSQADAADPWHAAMADQLTAAAVAHPSLQLVFADAGRSSERQVADIEQFVAQGVDMLIVAPNEAGPLTNAVAQAYERGVPVIVLGSKLNGDQFTTWIGADNKALGRRAGTYVAHWCAEHNYKPCRIMELRGLERSAPTRDRGNGFREGIVTNPDVRIVASQNADWAVERAVPLGQAMLRANERVDVVYAHSDPMAEGAYAAAESLQRDVEQLLFVGIDALPTPNGGLRSVLAGRIGVTYLYPTGASVAIDWTLKILGQGITPPKEITLATVEVTQANAAEVLSQYGALQVGQSAETP